MAAGHLGDVHETLDVVADLDERAERHDLGDLAVNDDADREVLDELLPRVFLGLLETEGDALAAHVHVEDLHLDLVAHGDDLGRVVHVAPAELGDVDQTVDAAEIDEGAEVDDRGHSTRQDHALDQLVEHVLALLLAVLLEHHAARKDDVVAIAVHLDDTRLEAITEEHVEVLHAAKVDERRRQEAAEADVDDETALDDLDDLALDVLATLELLLDVVPRTLVRGTLLGEDEPAVLVLLLENERLDLVAELHDVRRIGVLADGELARRDDALGLVADIEQDLVPLDLDHGTGHQVTVVEVGDGAVDEGVHLLVGVLVIVDLDVAAVLVYHCGWPLSCFRGPGPMSSRSPAVRSVMLSGAYMTVHPARAREAARVYHQ